MEAKRIFLLFLNSFNMFLLEPNFFLTDGDDDDDDDEEEGESETPAGE